MTDIIHKGHFLILSIILTLVVLDDSAFAGKQEISLSGPNGALLGWLMSNGELNSKSDIASFESVLQQAEMAYMDGAVHSTAAILACIIADPSFSELRSSPLWDNARYLLASSLAARGAVGKARKILIDLLSKVPPSDFAEPALRKLVDLTLSSRQFKQSLVAIEQTSISSKGDARDEILYLKGKALLQLGFSEKASGAFGKISNTSRLFAAAVFMQGIISLEAGRTDEAENFFCKLVHGGTEHKTPFYISDSASRVIENAWLALARIRHDRGQFEDAISTYSSIPPNSAIFPVAQYESAWSQFRLGDYSGARRTLQKLLESNVDFRQGPMAKILMGYSYLGQCNFDEAKALFAKVKQEQDSVLASLKDKSHPSGIIPREVLHWISSKKLELEAIKLEAIVEGSFLWFEWLRWELEAVKSISISTEVKRPEFGIEQDLKFEIDRAEGMLQRLAEMRMELGAGKNQVSALRNLHLMQAQVEAAKKRASGSLIELRACSRLNEKSLPSASAPISYLAEESKNLDALTVQLLLQQHKARQMKFSARVSLKKKSAAISAKLSRRAMLGKIDAVTGEKQSLETEVQNLALGRYPLSLLTDLAKAGLLDEQSEYWPFDGESWPDEYE